MAPATAAFALIWASQCSTGWAPWGAVPTPRNEHVEVASIPLRAALVARLHRDALDEREHPATEARRPIPGDEGYMRELSDVEGKITGLRIGRAADVRHGGYSSVGQALRHGGRACRLRLRGGCAGRAGPRDDCGTPGWAYVSLPEGAELTVDGRRRASHYPLHGALNPGRRVGACPLSTSGRVLQEDYAGKDVREKAVARGRYSHPGQGDGSRRSRRLPRACSPTPTSTSTR